MLTRKPFQGSRALQVLRLSTETGKTHGVVGKDEADLCQGCMDGGRGARARYPPGKAESVPGGADDEKANVVQRPPRARLRLRWGLLWRRWRLGIWLCWFWDARAAAQLSTHGLQQQSGQSAENTT